MTGEEINQEQKEEGFSSLVPFQANTVLITLAAALGGDTQYPKFSGGKMLLINYLSLREPAC